MMKTDAIGLYIHIPFCVKKCNYCDFCSYSGISDEEKEKYVDRLCSEIISYSDRKISINTIFFGGGTPTLLSDNDFDKIFTAIYRAFNVCYNSEITVEANPGTVTFEKIAHLKGLGVNRFSIGLQSIHENELKMLGRIHSYEDFKATYNIMRSLGIKNINVDIMYGIPEQTKESFSKTLSEVAALAPEHLSVYGLIIEPNTHFFEISDNLRIPGEDEECDMYFFASNYLAKLGYCHYEISNYAKSKYESKHNLKYWRDEEYIGVGLAAYSYYDGTRFGNTKSMIRYLLDDCPREYCEKINPKEEKYEFVMLALRLGNGFSLSEYKKRFGEDFICGREDIINTLFANGYLIVENDRIFLTDRGLYVSNYILTELL